MKKHLSIPRMLSYAILLTMVTLLIVSMSYARFTTTVKGEAVASVAAWESQTSKVTFDVGNMVPGNTKEFLFIITNKKGDRISEVSQNYTITFQTTNNLPLEFKLSSEGEALHSSQFVTIPATSAAAGKSVYSTEDKAEFTGGYLPNTHETAHTYVLTVNWPEEKTDASYADEIDLITINVNAKQAHPIDL